MPRAFLQAVDETIITLDKLIENVESGSADLSAVLIQIKLLRGRLASLFD